MIAVGVVGVPEHQREDEFPALLFVFTAVGSSQASEIGRFTFSCFKHSDGHKNPREEDCVNCRANAKYQD